MTWETTKWLIYSRVMVIPRGQNEDIIRFGNMISSVAEKMGTDHQVMAIGNMMIGFFVGSTSVSDLDLMTSY